MDWLQIWVGLTDQISITGDFVLSIHSSYYYNNLLSYELATNGSMTNPRHIKFNFQNAGSFLLQYLLRRNKQFFRLCREVRGNVW